MTTKAVTTPMGTTGTEPRPWTGVVLAGGRSSRMGRDKAQLDWRGQTLLAHARATLEAAGAAAVVVSGRYPGFDGIPDATPGLGPLGGVASVVAAVPDGVLLLVPVDMPLLTPALLRELAAHDAAACVTYRDHILPMRLSVETRSRVEIARLLSDPTAGRSLRALHAALDGRTIELGAGGAAELFNCNTPEQWQAVTP